MNRTKNYFYLLIALLNIIDVYGEGEKELLVNHAHCSKEELLSFFPQPVIESVLVKASIPREEAIEIAKELSQKSRELFKLVDKKAADTPLHSLQSSTQREVATKIYQETLYEVFAQTLKIHGMDDDEQTRSLLEEMRVTQSKLFVDCIQNLEIASSVD